MRTTKTKLYKLRKERKLCAITAYNALFAELADELADMILVGDSMAMVLYGHETTQPLTLNEMIVHAKSVVHATKQALIIVDMPFGSYEKSKEQAFANAAKVMKQTNAQAVKMEGGTHMAETIRFVSERGIPVVAHIGLTPQSVHAFGGFKKQATTEDSAQKAFEDAKAVIEAGAMALVLEHMEDDVARKITERSSIPTIGIGAGPYCDGHIAVMEDVLGLTKKQPPFTKAKANLRQAAMEAIAAYANDVKTDTEPHTALKNASEAEAISGVVLP